MFKRWREIPEIRSCLVIGPRRAGKTTLLRQSYPDWPYATLDDLDHLDWAKRDPKGFVGHFGRHGIIDEIQRLPLLTVAVKYAVDNAGARFLMTGSSTLGLLDASADTLAGRVDILPLPTACWGENLGPGTHRLFEEQLSLPQIRSASRRLSEAMVYGQFPEVLACASAAEKNAILVNYRNTYFTRDLMQLSNIENLDGLLAVFQHLARSIGSHLEISSFARESGLSQPTAKKYLNALLQSQLTFKLYGYQYGPAKRYLKSAKTYFSDNGILHSLNPGISEGQRMENFVLAELEKRRKLGLLPAEHFCYYKSTAGHEVDLVFEIDKTLYAIEIKATRNPGPRDLRQLRRFAANAGRPVQSFLFYQGESYETVEGVRLIPVGALFRSR